MGPRFSGSSLLTRWAAATIELRAEKSAMSAGLTLGLGPRFWPNPLHPVMTRIRVALQL
jgi:hypothetical protein